MKTTASERPTRYRVLSYRPDAPHIWRFVDNNTGAVIGPIYSSKAELLADLDRFYTSRYDEDVPACDIVCRVCLQTLGAHEKDEFCLPRNY